MKPWRKPSPALFDPVNLMFGDKINSFIIDPDWFDAPTHLIRLYQLLKLHKHWRDTHTVTYVGTVDGRFPEPNVFEWTFPTATYTPLSEWYDPKKKVYTVHRYADAIPSLAAEQLIMAFFDIMDGFIYDVPSLFNFIILELLGYDDTDYKPILDLGAKHMVCSVGARAADMRWYDALLKNTQCRRPGGPLHVERTSPALFPDHDTYLHLGTLVR